MKFFAVLAICCFGMMLYAFENMKKKEINSDKIANYISFKTVDKLEKKYGVVGCGFGLGGPDKINWMAINLEVYRILTLNEARKLLINCVEEYLHEINNNEVIQPYLDQTPFTLSNIQVKLFVFSKNRGEIYDPNICTASLVEGKIVYRTNDFLDQNKYKTTIEESYEEARKIVEEQV